jgi:NADH-quinone oxidoreductase subunit E
MGACVSAPIVAVHDYYHEDLTPESFEALMDKLARGEAIEPGSAIKRQTSAPEGEQKTLTDSSLFDGSLGKPVKIPGLPEKV